MNWRDLYTEANATEREQILHLLSQRIEARAEKTKVRHPSIRAWLVGLFVYCRGKFSWPRRARAHWIGSRHRLPRFERQLIVLLFACGMIVFEPREFVEWSVVSGSGVAVFTALLSMYRLIQCWQSNEIE
jgi:hypothetical protein